MLEQLSPESKARRLFWLTPTPTPDTTGPPAPTPLEPDNEAQLDCTDTVTLVWQTVNDPSGVSGYWGKLEQQVDEEVWQTKGWGPVSGDRHIVNVDCGGIYRWRVWAEDNAGNTGAWSALAYFSIELP